MDDAEWASVARQLPFLQVRRELLSRAHEDASLHAVLRGCFVRVVVGVTDPDKKKVRKGRVAQIDGVSDAKDGEAVYKLPSGARCSLKLRVRYDGKSRMLGIHEISDVEFKPEEIASYRKAAEKNEDEVIALEDVVAKREEFRAIMREKRRAPFAFEGEGGAPPAKRPAADAGGRGAPMPPGPPPPAGGMPPPMPAMPPPAGAFPPMPPPMGAPGGAFPPMPPGPPVSL